MNKKYGIVTGGCKGLGVPMAKELAREGYNVVITYNTQAEQADAAAVKSELEKEFGVQVAVCKLSVEDVESAKTLIDFAVQTFGEKMNVVINNAGVFAHVDLVDMDPANFDKVIDINLKGVFYVCHYAVPYMIKQHYGRIINLSSAVGLRGLPGTTAYAASKFGVRGLTQALACELGPYNITVNAIAPGSHKTDMYYSVPKERMAERLKSTPLQRAGELVEMEYVVRYLLASNFITGQVISMNGGTTMV